MSKKPTPVVKHKGNKPGRFWFDDVKGMTVDDKNLQTVAKAIGGSVEGNLVTVQGGHGELVIRKGDFVGTDQVGTWHIIRLTEVSGGEMANLGNKGHVENYVVRKV